jgi:hypothetical protein
MRRREGEERRARSINSSPILSQDALEELQTAIKEAESLSHSNSSQNSENLHNNSPENSLINSVDSLSFGDSDPFTCCVGIAVLRPLHTRLKIILSLFTNLDRLVLHQNPLSTSPDPLATLFFCDEVVMWSKRASALTDNAISAVYECEEEVRENTSKLNELACEMLCLVESEASLLPHTSHENLKKLITLSRQLIEKTSM